MQQVDGALGFGGEGGNVVQQVKYENSTMNKKGWMMKKMLLPLVIAVSGLVSQAAVVPVDFNQDGSFHAFLDAGNGLMWTTGKQVAQLSFDDAMTAVGSFTNEGQVWRLPTVQEFRQLYATQGHSMTGVMNYGGAFDFHQVYYWTSDATASPHYYHQSFAVNYAEASGDQTQEFAYYRLLGVIGVSPVSEPQTYALMLAGMGLMGAIVRRRKTNKDETFYSR